MNPDTLLQRLLLLLVYLVPAAAMAQEHSSMVHGAHVHGTAKLQVAVDSNTITLLLTSPMDSLLGFEHAPANATEKAALETLVSALENPASLFVFSAPAHCTSSSVKLASALIEDASHDSQHDEQHATHSDLDAEFVFTCTAADQLADLQVNLFDVAANLHDLEVEIAGPRGQKAAGLDNKQRSIRW